MIMKSKQFLLCLLALLVSIAARAYDIDLNGIYYNITDADAKTVEVTYVEDGEGNADFYSNAITIPNRFSKDGITYTVTAIGDKAFKNCTHLTSVIVGDNVTSIGYQSFMKCTNLTSVSLPDGLLHIGYSAFDDCYALASINIPSTARDIEGAAFSDCRSLTGITLPEGLSSIGEWLLDNCTFTEIVIPSTVTSIGNGAFSGCSNLTTANIPNGVTSIGEFAFRNCTALKSMVLPANVSNVGSNAFEGCSSLPFLLINATVPPTAGVNILINTSFPIYVPTASTDAYKTADGWASFDDRIKPQTGWTFTAAVPCGEGMANLTFTVTNATPWQVEVSGSTEDITGALTIPATVTDVATGLEFAVKSIGQHAFDGFENTSGANLTSVDIAEGVRVIGKWAFQNCPNLETVKLPESVETIDDAAFACSPKLATINLPLQLTTICGWTFTACSALKSINLPEGLTTIENYAFQETGLESIKFPTTLTTVEHDAFRDSKLTNIDFNGCSTTLGNVAFAGCNSLEQVYIPNSVSVNGIQVFNWCLSLKKVEFQEGYECPANQTFWHCTNLEEVILPTTKVFNWTGWFSECPNIKKVTFLDVAEGEGVRQMWEYNQQFDLANPTSCRFIIPEGKAELFLRKGYMNLSDLSGLPLVRTEFEAEATRIQNMADALTDGDKTALSNAISTARTAVVAAEDYLTIYAQIDAIKTAAKTYLTTASLPKRFDVTAATVTNPDFDQYAIGWKLPMLMDNLGYQVHQYTNDGININHFVEGWIPCSSTLENGNFSQTITNLPAGIYRLECDAIASWQDDANVEVTGVNLFAGSATTAVATENKKPQHFSVKFEKATKGDITIGLSINNTTANWVALDNVRLYYEGAVAAAPAGTELVSSEDDTYYIYNVGTGMYLNGGNGWGTQAVLAETGLPVRMTQDGDGYWQVYFREGSRNQQLLFASQVYDKAVFTDFYDDAGTTTTQWTITESDGSYTIQSCGDLGTNMLLGNDPTRQDYDWREKKTLDTHIDVIRTDNPANNTRWQFIKKADYDLYMAKRYLLATIFRMEQSGIDNENLLNSAQAVYDNDAATMDEVIEATTLLNSQMGMPQLNQPVDMTALIVNPRFENNTPDGWTGAKLSVDGNAQNTQYQTHEFYNTNFNMFQTITGVPNGLYRLKWKGFHRPGNRETVYAEYAAGTNNASAVVYANGVQKTMKHIMSEGSDRKLDNGTDTNAEYSYADGLYRPNNQSTSRYFFDEGFYADQLEVEVTDNVLTIGVKNTKEMGGEHWVIFSDFELEIIENAETYHNKLVASSGKGLKGGKAQLPILMENEGTIAGVQFKIRTPEGMTVATDGSGDPKVTATSRINGMTLMAAQQEGYTQVLIYGIGKNVKGNSGAIVNVALDIANTLDLGSYDIDIYDIVLTESNGLRIAPFSVKSTVTLVDAEIGDANHDGTVDVADIIAVANKILGRPSAQFDETAANVNGDSTVDVADIIGIANIILHGQGASARSTNNEIDTLDPQ